MKAEGFEVKRVSQDRLEMTKGGGCISVFGFPFFLAGLFILAMGMHLIPVSNAAQMPWWSWLVLCFMGLVFTAVGSALVFGRSWIVIDRAKSKIWIAWGLLKPMKGTVHNLEDYDSVFLNRVAGDSDSPDSYPVALRSHNGKPDLSIYSSGNYGNARQQAENLMEFLNIPLTDSTSDREEEVLPSSQRPSQGGNSPDESSSEPEPLYQPENLRSNVESLNDGIVIRIPGPRLTILPLIGFLIPLGIVLYFAQPVLQFFTQTHTPPQVQMVAIAFIGFFFVFLPIMRVIKHTILANGTRTRIIVTPNQLTLQNFGMFPGLKRTFPADRIIRVEPGVRSQKLKNLQNNPTIRTSNGTTMPVPNLVIYLSRFSVSQGIVIKSRNGIFYAGQWLSDEEIVYLCSLIREVLRQP